MLLGLVAFAALVVGSVLLLSQTTAPKGRTLESIFEDDQLLVDQPLTKAGNATVANTLTTLKSLGVDRIRVIVVWSQIAPGVNDASAPAGFDAADPGDYGTGWSAYDRIDAAAAADGIKVYFDLSAPAPKWAVTRQPAGTDSAAQADSDVYEPSAADFQKFVEAAGKRYSGAFSADGGSTPLPRVSFWSVWNEPNQPGWLSPQRSASGDAVAPSLYRSLVGAFWNGMTSTGHTTRRDTLLVGELAPSGCVSGLACAFRKLGTAYYPLAPLTFLQDLYCVAPNASGTGTGSSASTGDTPLTGSAATAVGCPADGNRATFVKANPGLFQASGLSEHPYSFFYPPYVGYLQTAESATFAPLAGLGKLTRTIDGALGAYGSKRQLPLYLTEYGYVTDPPNPSYPITPAQQAAFIDEGTYMAAQNPRVRALAQFELQDPDLKNSPFAEGLEYLGGRHKPAYGAYRVVIFLPGLEGPTRDAVPDTPVEVWGMLRAAPNDSTQTALIQWQASGGGTWRTIAHTTTRDPSGIIDQDVALPGSGQVRLAWRPAAGAATEYSRSVPVTVR